MEAIIFKKSSRLLVATILLLLTFASVCYAKSGKEIIQENGFKTSVAPMLATQWSQDGGENAMLPVVDGSGTRADAGCGAVAMAQVMNYWKYPTHGIGYNYYVWEEGTEPTVLQADFENTYYDWGNMAAVYKNQSVTDEQVDAVATLMLHIGTALEMKFSYSTATQIEYIHAALRKYFGYNPYMTIVRQINGAYTQDEWRAMIYGELSAGRPVLMGGTLRGGANHIFVADGYDEEGKIHLNLGHANRNNEDRYYDITKTDETYTIDMRMILGLQPEATGEELTTANVPTPGSLVDALGGELASRRVCRLKLTGTINADDMQWLSELTKITTGQLSYIDLSECTIEGNAIHDDAFGSSSAPNYTLQEIILPDDVTRIGEKAFANCRGLVGIHLPKNLQSMGAYVFSDCRYLSEINLPSSVNSIGSNPFRYSKIENFTVDAGNNWFNMAENALVDADGGTLYAMPVKYCGNYSVPDGVEVIGGQAFIKCCTIDILTLPTTLERVGSYAFAYCYGLTDVYSHAVEAPVLGGSAFYPESTSCVLHVPEGCADEYRQNGWDIFAKIVDDIKSGTSGVESVAAPKRVVGMYTIDGLPVASPQPDCIYIYKYDDGTAEKKIYRR